ncbi:MAG: dihydrodipicolinate synthase family protein [Opitutae bacterium]|nr:dihydrodipicolinate synthase family protein [Opitutae bacterium]
MHSLNPDTLETLRDGVVIPAHPLALTSSRSLDERRQVALTRYYLDAGAGGVAVGVHTTQFNIREPQHGLLSPVLELAAVTVDASGRDNVIKVAGICGPTSQAVAEAGLAAGLSYDLGLLNLGALRDATIDELIDHCRAVADVIPVFGFFLNESVGGRHLPLEFWQRFVEIPNVLAIKVAAFNRYQTFDVVRAVAEAGRAGDIALYTGNDDNILLDLVTEYAIPTSTGVQKVRFSGGLLGHWAVWTKTAVGMMKEARQYRDYSKPLPQEFLTMAMEVTDANAVLFDAANGFAGCIPGIHEILYRQGLLAGTWCLDPDEVLSPDQSLELDRISNAYGYMRDDDFVAENLDRWMR